MIAEIVNMDTETLRKILHNQLNTRKVGAKMNPRNLTQEQKLNRKNICSEIMEQITEQLDVLENVIIYDEMWIFQYDLETKRQLMHWRTPILELIISYLAYSLTLKVEAAQSQKCQWTSVRLHCVRYQAVLVSCLTCCSYLKVEAVHSSETFMNLYQT
jgi:hypothetical protein